MMSNTSTLDIVCKCIAERMGKDVTEIKPEHDLVIDVGADSLDLAEIMLDLEDEFRLCFTEDSYEKATVAEIAEAIDARIEAIKEGQA
ncbi:MAG: acyl carrier protein [Chloroflexota bacterium]